MANEFYKHLWEPKKTSRDWGTTEYRIIKNWTPRVVAGSGSSSHTARRDSNQEIQENSSNFRHVERDIADVPLEDDQLRDEEADVEEVLREVPALTIRSEQENFVSRHSDSDDNLQRTVQPSPPLSPNAHARNSRSLGSRTSIDESENDLLDQLDSSLQQSRRRRSKVSEISSPPHEVPSQLQTTRRLSPISAVPSQPQTRKRRSPVSGVPSKPQAPRRQHPVSEVASQPQSISSMDTEMAQTGSAGSRGDNNKDVEMEKETESSEEDVAMEPLPQRLSVKKQRRKVTRNASTFPLWLTRFKRTSRDLNELDICLSIYDATMRDAIENQSDAEVKRVMSQHWKLTLKYMISTIKDISAITVLEKKHRQELAKRRKLQKEYVSLLERMRKVNGRYMQTRSTNKQSRHAHMVELEQAEIEQLSDMVSAHVSRQNSHR